MYLTIYKSNQENTPKIDYNDINNQIVMVDPLMYYKYTIKIDNPKPINELPRELINKINQHKQTLNQIWEVLKPFEHSYTEQYYTFKIPKRSQGLRTIHAPLPAFKAALTTAKDLFENKMKCLAHPSAYAYTKNRSTYDALELHQKNESNWYLKIDLTDFFANCTPDLIFKQLMQIFPFYYLEDTEQTTLKNIIKVCCLDNGLPQGTPMSPFLTNLLMVPYDYILYNYLTRGSGEHYVYTRYADDILISSKSAFDWRALTDKLAELLKPFEIKRQKTRYGSKAGSNWNLGLMLNKDNKITLGHQKKKLLNAILNNFLNNFSENRLWSREDTYELQGQLSYLQHIEEEYYNYIMRKYQDKHNVNFKQAVKRILNPHNY